MLGSAPKKRRESGKKQSAVIIALQNLRESGDNSFEELVARLLSGVSQERIRRCKAGSQGGVDALAAMPFALETKRYRTQLRARDLIGGLTEAAVTNRDLQLWVLVTTSEVAAQTRVALESAGSNQGIGVLILDVSTSDPDLPDTPLIAALAATDADLTIRVVSDSTWRKRGSTPNRAAIRRALTAIRNQPGFDRWSTRLSKEIRELPTWRNLVRSQNDRLLRFITGAAASTFGTEYHPEKAIPRTAEAELTAWWNYCATSATCQIAVITGERYDGKTWLVYRWLSANLRVLPVPVFLFSSEQVQAANGDLEALILQEAERALGRFGHHAKTIIALQKSRTDVANPWCIVVLDGANEYTKVPAAFPKAVVSAVPPRGMHDHVLGRSAGGPEPELPREERRGALLLTCRTGDFDERSAWLPDEPGCRIQLAAYDDQEFDEALKRHSLDRNQFAHLPEAAAEMVRHPRYMGLLLRYRDKLGYFAGITADVLCYLDATEKVVSWKSTGWDPEGFTEFLQNLAVEWSREKTLSHSSLRAHVGAVTGDVDTALQELRSAGVVQRTADGLVPHPGSLALGMGLFIRQRLIATDEASLRDVLRDILAPNSGDDEKVRWLRAAVTVSALAEDNTYHPATLDCLLSAWITSRNFSQRDLYELRNLSPILAEPMLRLVSAPDVADSVLLLAEPMIEAEVDRHELAVASAVRTWFRLVPTDRRWFAKENDQEEAANIALAISDSSLDDLELKLAGNIDRSARKRRYLGLSLAARHPSLVRPIDALALIAVLSTVDSHVDSGVRFALARIVSEGDRSWYEGEIRTWETKPEAIRTRLLRDLVSYADRKDWAELGLPANVRREWPAKRFTPSQLKRLTKSGDSKQMLQEACRAGNLALNPASAPPSRSWRSEFENVVLRRFSGMSLSDSRSVSRDALDLEQVEPALTAWAARTGAQIWQALIADIPRQIAQHLDSWAWAITGHVALLSATDRRNLLQSVLSTSARDSDFKHTLRRGYLCVLAGSSSSQRLRLLLEHPFDLEWTEFYETLGVSSDETLRQHTFAAVRQERDPLRLKRARFLLAQLGGAKLSANDLFRLISDSSRPARHGEFDNAAHFLLQHSRVPSATPAEYFGPMVQVANSLAEAAWQYDAFLHIKRQPGMWSAAWLARAHSAPGTARHNGADPTVSDEIAVRQGIQRLAIQIQEYLATSMKRAGGGHSEQFPDDIVAAISESTFNSWVQSLLSSPARARHSQLGLLLPVVRHALRTRHPRARELWTLVTPFQRDRFSPGERIVVHGGLDWTLSEIHEPDIDDDVAMPILRELVVDCRSNSELVGIALGARLAALSRLTRVVEEFLGSKDSVYRAKARFLAGWMPENRALRTRLTMPDSSIWVERIGIAAIDRLNHERWAREWLRRFLSESNRTRRWAAGRLFLSCSDAATPFWAPDMVYRSRASTTRRAEASLLTGRIRKKADDSEMRDKFLLFSVSDLSPIMPPWRQQVRWDEITINSGETL